MGCESLPGIVERHPDLACKFLKLFKQWKECREMTLSSLSDAIKELDKLEEKSSFNSCVGTSVFIAGGMTAIVSVALLPVTFGLSSAGVVGGAITGLSTIATSSTAKIVEHRKVCLLLDKVNDLLTYDHELFQMVISDFLSLLKNNGMAVDSISSITQKDIDMKLRRSSWEVFDDEPVRRSKLPIPSHSSCLPENSDSFRKKFADLRDSIENIEVQGYDKDYSKPKGGTHFFSKKQVFLKKTSYDDDYFVSILGEELSTDIKEFPMNKINTKTKKKYASGTRFSKDITHDNSKIVRPLLSTDGGQSDTEYEACPEEFKKLMTQFALFGTGYKLCRNLAFVCPEFQQHRTKGKPKSIEILRNVVVALKDVFNKTTIQYQRLWDVMDCTFADNCTVV